MKRHLCGLLFVAMLAGCGSTAQLPSGDPVRLGALGFDVPPGWQRSDFHQQGSLISVWTPDATSNTNKESITVIQSGAISERLDDQRLQKLLSGAQIALNGVKTSQVSPLTTETGLAGYRLEVEFTPQHSKDRYRRSHVVLRDHGVLVHVIYTARTADPERTALETVLATVHHAEASS